MRAIFLTVLFWFPSLLLSGQTKHALLIGLGNYMPESGWASISSANDIPILKEALLKRGFKEKDIHIYIDALDRQGIIEVMDKHLVKGVGRDDIVFFHFSGHGQQIVDNNKDELDGLDESLVPVDAPVSNVIQNGSGGSEPYQFNRHLKDDDLGAKLTEIRRQLGPNGNIMVSIDACHSGTSTRGIGKSRGTTEPNVPDGWISPFHKSSVQHNNEKGKFELESKGSDLAKIVCFYGSDQSQLNYEYLPAGDSISYGSLSYALSLALNDTDPGISYRSLFEQVQTVMSKIAPNQTPRVEGDLDQIIFGGQLLNPAIYYRVEKFINDTCFIINAGYLLNMNEGSRVGFFAQDTRDPENTIPLAIGTVKISRVGDAMVILDTGQRLTKDQAEKTWCYPLEINYGNMGVKIRIAASRDDYQKLIQQKFSENTFFHLVSGDELADLLLEYGVSDLAGNTNRCVLTTSSDIVLFNAKCTAPLSLEDPILYEVIEIARQYAQSSFLRSLSVNNPDLKAEVLLIPRKIKSGYENRPEEYWEYEDDSLAMQKMKTQDFEIEEGSFIQFKIRNYSPSKVYYTLFDLYPDFKFSEVNLLYPSKGKPASEYVVPPYGEVSGETFRIYPPFGIDHLILLVSPKPLDMRSIIKFRNENGMRGKGTGTAIETLFRSSFMDNVSVRGSVTSNVVTEEIGIYRKVYRIVPKGGMSKS